MSPNKPSVVIFDLGNVLIDWNPRHLYRQIFDDLQEMEWFLAEVCNGPWNLSLDGGRTFKDAIAEKISAHPAYKTQIEAFQSRWIDMIGGPIQGTVDILETLVANKTPLFALTNWSRETFPLVRHDPTYDFLNHFQQIVVSGEIELVKPDPAIFHHTLDVVKAEAQDCLFIDDNPDNCASAREIGLQVHEFSKPEGLKRELEALKMI